jgi:hypothetical protein
MLDDWAILRSLPFDGGLQIHGNFAAAHRDEWRQSILEWPDRQAHEARDSENDSHLRLDAEDGGLEGKDGSFDREYVEVQQINSDGGGNVREDLVDYVLPHRNPSNDSRTLEVRKPGVQFILEPGQHLTVVYRACCSTACLRAWLSKCLYSNELATEPRP